MSFMSLPTGTLYKKPEKKKLRNFPAGYVGKFYRNLANNIDNFLGSEFYGRIAMMLKFPLTMLRNISWQLVILQKECKQTLTTMWQRIELTTQALDKSLIQ